MGDSRPFVLPDEACQLLHQLSVDNDLVQFTIGDTAEAIIAEFEGRYPAVEIKRALAAELRCEPFTLTDRIRVARVVPPVLRDRYQLSFHQWRACANVRDKSQVEAVAQWAVAQADGHGGRSASVLAIRRYLRDGGDDTPGWLRTWTRLLDLAATVASDESAPGAVRSLCYRLAEKARHISY